MANDYNIKIANKSGQTLEVSLKTDPQDYVIQSNSLITIEAGETFESNMNDLWLFKVSWTFRSRIIRVMSKWKYSKWTNHKKPLCFSTKGSIKLMVNPMTQAANTNASNKPGTNNFGHGF